MKINHRSLLLLLFGGVILFICHGIAMDRNGASTYNFLLFCAAHFLWGYYWGGRLLKLDDVEEEEEGANNA